MAVAAKSKPETKPTRESLDRHFAALRERLTTLRTDLASAALDDVLDFDAWIAKRRDTQNERLRLLREIVSTLKALRPIYEADAEQATKERLMAEQELAETIGNLQQEHYKRLGPERSKSGAAIEIVRKLVNMDQAVSDARVKQAHAASNEATLRHRIQNFSSELSEAEKQLRDEYLRGVA